LSDAGNTAHGQLAKPRGTARWR